MQQPDTHDAPLVPYTPNTSSRHIAPDGGSRPSPGRPLDRPPATDHATNYTRCTEEIEPFVPDLS